MAEVSKKKTGAGEMIRLGLILVIYAVVSCTVLAVVNNFTNSKIMQNSMDKANSAMKEVFSQADSFVRSDDFGQASGSTVTVSDFYIAMKDGKICGGVVQVSGPTYDKAKIIIGMDLDGTVTGVRFLENTDSPGFGLKASDPTFRLPDGQTFYGQFTGKKVSDGFIAGKTFDAISGATITSAGTGVLISEGTSVLAKYFENHKEGQ